MLLDCTLQVDSVMKTALMAETEIAGVKERTCVRHVSILYSDNSVVDELVLV